MIVNRDQHMLTTTDNPFDPVTQFKEWYVFDTSRGYNSLSLLARIAHTTDEMGDDVQTFAIEEAIDEIVRENVSGMHTKIKIE